MNTEKITDNNTEKVIVDAILIDDDPLVQIAWKISGRQRRKQVQCYTSPYEFLAQANNFDFNTPVYIDSNLGDGVKGEAIAKQIFELGFSNVYLATGYLAEDFPPMPWIKDIIGKDAPWVEESIVL